MKRYEIDIKQVIDGQMVRTRTTEVIAKTSTQALGCVIAALNPQGMFVAVVRPYVSRQLREIKNA